MFYKHPGWPTEVAPFWVLARRLPVLANGDHTKMYLHPPTSGTIPTYEIERSSRYANRGPLWSGVGQDFGYDEGKWVCRLECVKAWPQYILHKNATLTDAHILELQSMLHTHSTRLPPMLTWFNPRPGHSRIFASGNSAGRCRSPASFLGDLPFPPPLHSGVAPISHHLILIGYQYLVRHITTWFSQNHDDKSYPNLFARSLFNVPQIREHVEEILSVNIQRAENLPRSGRGTNPGPFDERSAILPQSYGSRAIMQLIKATVVERLARSHLTKANRAQSPAGSPDSRKWESCRTMPLVGGFSRGSPAFPPLHSSAAPNSLQSPSSALKISMLRAAQITSITLLSSNTLNFPREITPEKRTAAIVMRPARRSVNSRRQKVLKALLQGCPPKNAPRSVSWAGFHACVSLLPGHTR
ncbi:hypothetical protein PR048_013465, partial [Dryococelus australis]